MRPKILLVQSGNETFVRLDWEILSEFADVQDFFAARKFPAELIRYWRGLKDSDLLFCWFASWNSFWALLLAQLFHKPSILVIGGYDLAKLPEANYGQQRGGFEKWVSRAAMKLATVLVTNSYYSQQEAEQNAGIPTHSVQVIYHGVPDPFGTLPQVPREYMALTVGKVDRFNLMRKGLEPFVRAAAYLPDMQFVVIGAWADDSIQYLRSFAPPNVLFTGRVSDTELRDYYQKAPIYVQPSLHEGFGLSVAEAMLAGCIPVVTRQGSLPEVVGEQGIYCDTQNPSEVAKAIRTALNSSPALREHGRERILRLFPMQGRRQALEGVVRGLWRDNASA